MDKFTRGRLFSFRYAFAGLRYVLVSQKNAWIHAAATVIVVVLAAILRLSLTDWGILLLAIGLVWAAEVFNTSIEAFVDLVSPYPHPLAKTVKDTSAAAVLVTAIISILIALVILVPPLIQFFQK